MAHPTSIRTGKLTAKDFLKEVASFGAELRATIEAEVDGFDPDPKAIAERRRRVLDDGDFEYFCRTYFPHYVKGAPSLMHRHVFERVPAIFDAGKSVYEWLMAPRGEAKSTTVTQLGSLFALVTEKKRFLVIIMATIDLSIMMLEAIKAELETNPRIAMDFPEIAGKGRVWKEAVVLTRRDQKIMAAGAGKKLRGMRHGPFRPDFVLLDDMENDENVRSPEQRKKLDDWIDRAVVPLGPPGGKMDIFYVGTLLHYDAVLARKSKNPMWRGRKFRSVMQWPNRMDLWESWEATLRNDGVDAADDFYAAHKAEMDDGAEVSWPSVRPIEVLMKLRILIGVDAFNSEQQNDPLSDSDAPFRTVKFWVNRLSDWVMVGAHDSSLGKKNPSRDFSATGVGGFHIPTGTLDVIEALVRRVLPDIQIAQIIELQRQYRCRMWAFEAIGFQEFMRTELLKRSAAAHCPVPARAIDRHDVSKEIRILSMQPYIGIGLIRFHPSQTVLLEQLQNYPMADHDDGPDMIEMMWTMSHQLGRGLRARSSGRQRSTANYGDYRNMKG